MPWIPEGSEGGARWEGPCGTCGGLDHGGEGSVVDCGRRRIAGRIRHAVFALDFPAEELLAEVLAFEALVRTTRSADYAEPLTSELFELLAAAESEHAARVSG